MRYGLIAGNGRFPFMVVEGARRAGVSLSVAAIREETDPRIESEADRVTWVGIGQLGKMIRFFKGEGVEKAIMAGQVRHVQIFSRAIPDARMLKLLLKLPRRNTNSLIGAVAAELASEGIDLIDSTIFLQDYLPAPGNLTSRKPNAGERADTDYGLEIAREMARLDLGQTIVVRAKACVAIEAMEGTDETIKRAGELMRGGNQKQKKLRLTSGSLTVLKLSKPEQDMRFDVPVVGLPTIETMIEAGATCLCISAGKTLMFDRDEMIALANKNKIAIVAV
ncbi:MAG TPA: UDP-2,3-diacylglucosamine diphosphatase LpxI [Pyrinomonadaceae bacterium]|nr:UDP-2,3-diacylglucosamine diphosphatase LpxI [Pyrinomonadaceae bacterium]